MQERQAGAGEILHAEEHPELLGGSCGEEGFGLSLTGFESYAGVALLASEDSWVWIRV